MIEIRGHAVPNTTEEITVKDFDAISVIDSDQDKGVIEKWVEKFCHFGVPEEAFDDMSVDELVGHTEAFNSGFEVPEKHITEVEIDGFKYAAPDILGAKDVSLIEKAMNKDKSSIGRMTLAIVFKREDLSRTEHYTDAHIKQKAKLFADQPCKLVLPYLTDVMNSLLRSTEETLEDAE